MRARPRSGCVAGTARIRRQALSLAGQYLGVVDYDAAASASGDSRSLAAACTQYSAGRLRGIDLKILGSLPISERTFSMHKKSEPVPFFFQLIRVKQSVVVAPYAVRPAARPQQQIAQGTQQTQTPLGRDNGAISSLSPVVAHAACLQPHVSLVVWRVSDARACV